MQQDGTVDGRATPAAGRGRARFRVLQLIRAGAATLVLLCLVAAPASLAPHPHVMLPLTVAYGAAAGLAGVVVTRRPERRAVVLHALLLVDAAYLTVGTHLTGEGRSPLQYALLVHLAAVTLLASARTGLVLAGLETLLLLGLRMGVQVGWVQETAPPLPAPAGQQLAILLVVVWVVALATATLAVLNRRELRRRRHDLDALTLLTERVERAARPAAVAQLLLDAVVSTYELKRGLVLLATESGHELLATTEQDRDVTRTGVSQVVGRAGQERSSQVLRGLDPEDAWLGELLPDAGPLLVVPLLGDARPLGALVLEGQGRVGALRRLVTGLERSAAYGALALRNAALLESVQRLAVTDGLTGIANRRAFEGTLERELSRATRAAEYVSLVLIDLDHFKSLNDSLGHQAGDRVLRDAARALAEQCREFDTPARYGGEEFAVILPGCGPEQAQDIADRLRRAVCATAVGTPVTASAGVATFPAHAGDADSLVQAADEALYAAKRAGRDRTTVSAGISPEEQVNALIRRAVRERLRARDAQAGETEGLIPPMPLLDRRPSLE